MAITSAAKSGPDSLQQLHGLAILRCAGAAVHIRKSDWRVQVPSDQEGASWWEALGVCQHAKQAVARGEGIDPPRDHTQSPGKKAFNEAMERMRGALR
jgi:hypothetical protein